MSVRPGLFGKLPAHGDFVRRNLPRSFVAPWDAWLSEGVLAAPDAVWEVWRFHLAPGLCGPAAATGVVAPSADSVGRRFPLTLAALDLALIPPESWFTALEALAASPLDADALATLLPDAPADGSPPKGASRFWTPSGRELPMEAGFAALLAP
jgi:type VI secretion system protein ImpM